MFQASLSSTNKCRTVANTQTHTHKHTHIQHIEQQAAKNHSNNPVKQFFYVNVYGWVIDSNQLQLNRVHFVFKRNRI